MNSSIPEEAEIGRISLKMKAFCKVAWVVYMTSKFDFGLLLGN
jgi:hypothetical protein